MADTQCLKTRVANATGRTATFGFLPPHGKRLADGEVYEFEGSFDGLLSSITKKRQREGLLYALENGHLRLLQTPSQVMWDGTQEEAKIVTVSNGTLASADVCWGYASSAGPNN